MPSPFARFAIAALLALGGGAAALAHGDVTPQPVNTDALPDVGTEWAEENPYRKDPAVYAKAIRIGSSAFNQNCARCHGLGAVSGGLAPDLRFLEPNRDGDEWFLERFRHGVNQNGVTKMPVFGDILGQKAGWAIKSYIETRPEDGALKPHSKRLGEIRDALKAGAEGGAKPDAPALAKELQAIGAKLKTASGAPHCDSPASHAAELLLAETPDLKAAYEALTVGLSAAH